MQQHKPTFLLGVFMTLLTMLVLTGIGLASV
jgi:hypothetical protein